MIFGTICLASDPPAGPRGTSAGNGACGEGGGGWSVLDSSGKSSEFAVAFGTSAHVAVERGLAEFRSGRPVIITGLGERLLALPVDGMDDGRLGAFRRLCRQGRPYLVVTARRA